MTDEIWEDRLQQNPLFDYAARNWGNHARGDAEHAVQDLASKFLMDDLKVAGSSQALFTPEYRYSGYSQWFPKQCSSMHLVSYFGLDMVTLLLEKGAHVDSKDTVGRTPLWLAAQNGHEAVVKLLVEKGAHVDSKNTDGWTPLWLAARNGHEAMVKLLVEKGAVVDSKDNYGWTVLGWAAAKGYEAVVKLLVEKGAVIDSKDNYGWTPLWRVAANGHEAVVKLLTFRLLVNHPRPSHPPP